MRQKMISEVLKERFGTKVYKLSLTSGCTCPNRDGRIGTGGCTFCSGGGSGEFAAPLLPLEEQIREARRMVDRKISARILPEDRRYIAYFQSFTNTYVRTEEEYQRFRALYTEAVQRPEIAVLSIGTRPDCLPPKILQMLVQLQEIKPVWVELGLQTMHEQTAAAIHRGYSLPVFEQAVRDLKRIGVEVVVHVIFGLPGETREDMLETVRYLADLRDWESVRDLEKLRDPGTRFNPAGEGKGKAVRDPAGMNDLAASHPMIDGIKLQQLQILRGTQMAEEYQRNPFPVMDLEEYCALIHDCLDILPEDIVIHRLTGDGPKSLLIAPSWSADKKRVLNMMKKWM
ncbi:MAG: TIGR01212 family radical SAM protein [Eubacteriales bacterium]|nr:TIGR01212 family radical SAM protein [Eubacteriales bacterium]